MILGIAALIPAAKATTSLQFTTDQNMCCGTVTLTSVNSTEVQVTVTLGSGETFVNTGNGTNHPGFAFNIKGDPAISFSNIATNKPADTFTIGNTNDQTGGPNYGVFDYTLNAPGSGASDGVNELTFDVTSGGNLTPSDFVANAKGYFFETDIGLNGNTAESGSKGPGTPLIPCRSLPRGILVTVVGGCLPTVRKHLRA